jgi:hypothetical protein
MVFLQSFCLYSNWDYGYYSLWIMQEKDNPHHESMWIDENRNHYRKLF